MPDASLASPSPAALARRYRYAVSLAFLVNGAAFASWVSRIPALRAGLGMDDGELGIALLALALGVMLSFPLTARGVRLLGARRLTLLAGAAALVVLPMPFTVGTPVSLSLVLFEFGMASGAMDVAMNVMAVDAQERAGRPIMSRLHGLWSLGGALGAGGGSAAAHAGLPPLWHLAAVSALLAIALVGSARLARGTGSTAAESSASADSVDGARSMASANSTASTGSAGSMGPDGSARGTGGRTVADPAARPRPRRRVRLDAVLAGLGLVCMCSFIVEGGMADWSGVLLRTRLHTSEAVAALGFALFSGAMMTVRFVGDRLIARFGTRALCVANTMAALALAVGVLSERPAVCLAAFALVGLAVATVVPTAFSAAARHAREVSLGADGAASLPGEATAAGAIAWVSGFGYGGMLAGPPVIGALSQAFDLRWGFGLLALLLLVIAMLAPGMGRAARGARVPTASPAGTA